MTTPGQAAQVRLNSTSLADLDVAGRRFDDRSIQELVFNGPGGTITGNKITARDRNGKVTAETIDGHEYRYTYDNYDRLVDTQFGVTGFSTPDDTWQYCYQDAWGTGGAASSCTGTDVNATGKNSNRVSSFHDGVKTAGYVYDSADRLTSVTLQAPYAGKPINYDTRGNTSAIGGETLKYDGADRHMSTNLGTTTVTYQRDALDRIVSRVAADGTTRYTYGAGGDTASAVLDATSTLTQTTLALPGGVMLTRAGSTDTWSYPNLQGSIVAIADATGTKQGATIYYDPYGNTIAPGALPDNSAGNLDYGWLGQYQRPVEHATGLRQQTEMGARGYDAQLGRFLEVDPIEGGVDNDYGYVSDPRGDADLNGQCGFSTYGVTRAQAINIISCLRGLMQSLVNMSIDVFWGVWDGVKLGDSSPRLGESWLNYHTDGCSGPLPHGLRAACWRHDMIWRNWWFLRSTRAAGKALGNSQFRSDLGTLCSRYPWWFGQRAMCFSNAGYGLAAVAIANPSSPPAWILNLFRVAGTPLP